VGDSVPAPTITARVAALRTADETCAGVAAVFVDRYSATTPATCGAAIDVPDKLRNVEGEPMYAAVIEEPGAKTSTHRPQLEKEARASLGVDAPTVIATDADAGE
jgi:hypothetical protein